jgi:hypothetical protein
MSPPNEHVTPVDNPFWEIELYDGRRIYVNRLAIASFEQDPAHSNITWVQLVNGERLKLDEHVKSFWDRFDNRNGP